MPRCFELDKYLNLDFLVTFAIAFFIVSIVWFLVWNYIVCSHWSSAKPIGYLQAGLVGFLLVLSGVYSTRHHVITLPVRTWGF